MFGALVFTLFVALRLIGADYLAVRLRSTRERPLNLERETGANAPSTNHPVEFIYRLAPEA